MSPRIRSKCDLTKFAVLSLIAGVLVPWQCRADAATLEFQLHKHAPQILSSLRGRSCHRIGVLKFQVQKVGQRPSDCAGTLNTFLAERLEVALALANSTDPAEQIQLVHNASRVAAQTPEATHLSPSGRQRLFSQRYPLAWDNRKVELDALVTGVVQVAPDLRSVRIGIVAAIKGEPELLGLLPPIVADTDGAILNELGESFQLRSGPDGQRLSDPATSAGEVQHEPPANFPLDNKPTVALRVFYDGQPVTLEFTESEAIIPEPGMGQSVTFQLERMDQSDVILGVVLKVNGENTLYRQRVRDFDCAKWVLNPGHRATVIHGFQKANSTEVGEAFEVVSTAASRALEMHYGPDVGTISLTVFEETKESPQLSLSEDAPDLAAIAKAQFPAEPPRNADALKAQLRNVGATGTRGVITDGDEIQQRVQLVRHDWRPEPIMSVVIRYYRPQD
ncbi:MAG: hypothetical protein H6822_29555 [Planctomycetaceae bacterium]|nr:hypothetical protein [Planctomycetales bacterium]MCB9926330.1 hypothetical protein [Planctomycetaceae bacterium]